MDELTLLRNFRRGAAGPSEEARRRASDRLTGAIEGRRRQRTSILQLIRRRPGRTVLVLAAVVGATSAALFVSSPWKTTPGFLEQVQAAITPRAGTVLHVKLVMTENRSLGCVVTHPPSEWWVDLGPPYNWRTIDVKQTDPCKAGSSVEIGGKTTSGRVLGFFPPHTLATRRDFYFNPDQNPDPAAGLLEAIEGGTARVEGNTMLDDGRAVVRIRIDCTKEQRAKFPGCGPIYTYVDPETFLPVRHLSGPGLRPGPGASCTAPCFAQDYLTYEYLPGTQANHALADIRAQHPDATEGPAPAPAVHVPKLTGAVAKTVRAAQGAKSARVTFKVTATNADGLGDIPVWCEPRSGSRFPLGKTIVRCGATDPNGNRATAEFTVTVERRR